MIPLDLEQVTDPTDPLVAELAERQFRSRIRYRYVDETAGRAAAADLVAGLLPDSRLVRTQVGFVWLGPDTEHTPVLDVGADDVEDVPALRDLAAELAGAPLGPSVIPGEPVREAFVADGSFRLVATSMRLDMTGVSCRPRSSRTGSRRRR